MRILLTGASGFLGIHLKTALENEGNNVVTYGRAESNDIVGEITESFSIAQEFDVVIHAVGKAHVVPKTDKEKKEFFEVNVEGTHNLLSALEKNPPKKFVFISTVAVYGKEAGENIDEDAPLLGESPYAKSKIEAEKMVQEWCEEKGIIYLILRLPLISGANPPGNLGAMANAIQRGFYFRIGNGNAKRSMIGAGDVANFILKAADSSGVFNLTDGINPTIAETDSRIAEIMGKRVLKVPFWIAKVAGHVGGILPGFPLNPDRLKKLTATLTFSNAKALKTGWNPKPALDELSFSKKVNT